MYSSYTVRLHREPDGYVATCVEYPSLSWVADTEEKAEDGLFGLIEEVERDLGLR